jgi:hypothetical protein
VAPASRQALIEMDVHVRTGRSGPDVRRIHMLRKLAATGVVAFAAAGAIMVAAPAQAGDYTRGDRSILGGNQVFVPVSIPVNACGNAVAVVGFAGAGCKGGAKVKGGHPGYGY